MGGWRGGAAGRVHADAGGGVAAAGGGAQLRRGPPARAGPAVPLTRYALGLHS